MTPKAKEGIKALIGDTSIADVASWADQVMPTLAYKYTGVGLPEIYAGRKLLELSE